MHYDPYAKLDEWGETLLALGLNGSDFASYAANNLACRAKNGGSWEVHYWMLRSCFARQDTRTARMYVNDWSHQSGKPSANVSKWIPGDHYHCLDQKFDTLQEAVRHLQSRGYQYGGLVERHVYTKEGD